MHRPSVALTCAVLVLLGPAVGTGAMASARPGASGQTVGTVVRPADVAPARVTHLHVYAVHAGVTVHWQNPPSSFDHVVVRYARGYTAPTHSTLGRRATTSGPRATVARLSHLGHDSVYTVAVWTVDGHGRRSGPTKSTFTSGALAGKRGDYVGRVLDAQEHPLLNAEVSAIDYTGNGSISARTRTDVHGRFRLRMVPGTWQVTFGGQHISGGDSDATGYLDSAAQIVVHASRTTRAGNVALAAGGAVSGRVTDAAGNPLAGVQTDVVPVGLEVTGDDGQGDVDFGFVFDNSDAVFTASDGRYTIKGVPVGEALKVCMATAAGPVTGGDSDRRGYGDRCLPLGVEVKRGQAVAEPDLALDGAAGGAVGGTLTAPSGTGLGGWFVSFGNLAAGATGESEGYAVTKPDGRFEAAGLSPGSYQMCVTPAGPVETGRTGFVARCRQTLVTVRTGHTAEGNLTLALGAAVSGRVTGPGGVPLDGVDVEVSDPYFESEVGAITDASGHYKVKGVPPGRSVACYFPGGVRAKGLATGALIGCYRRQTRFSPEAGAVRTGIDGRLGPAGAISGTLRDSAGKPLAFTEVDIDDRDTEEDNGGGTGTTNAAGHYVVAGLPAGKYSVCFRSYADDLRRSITCHHGPVRTTVGRTVAGIDGVFPLGPNSSIAVSVHDTAGRPVAGVESVVVVRCPADEHCRPVPVFNPRTGVYFGASTVTDRAGTGTLTGLRPGRYAVCLFAYYAATPAGTPPDGYADRCSGSTASVVVRADRTTTLHATLHDGGAVSGTVTDRLGHPLAGVVVNVTGSAADDYGTSNFDGGDPTRQGPSDDAVTRANGTFTIRSVQPGTSTVCADAAAADGPDAGGYFDQCLGGKVGSEQKGAGVTVTKDINRTGTDLALTPAAGISGTVTAPGGPSALSGQVLLYVGHTEHLVGNGQPDEAGEFAFLDLRPGTYSVCFDSFALTPQCYRNVVWKNDGQNPPLAATTLVTATAGVLTKGIDFHLHN